MTRSELEWFYGGGGAAAFFPDLWARFIAPIPEDERGDLVAAYGRRLFSGNLIEEGRLARIWANWENALASIHYDGGVSEGASEYSRAFARLENHYFQHHGFLEHDGWILANRGRIEHIPAHVVQGRYDMICPPRAATRLCEGWEKASLRLIGMAGHALSEPGISGELVRIMDNLRPPG